MASLPLADVRVLDFTRVLAGPLCTMMLGDLGADVIKVERPGTGDETRGWGPPFAPDGASAYFRSVNRNKRSVAVDLDAVEDRGLLETLLGEADVAVDNFRPGTLERRGLHPAALLERHPRLIWCTVSGFADGDRPGYDFVVQAECGWMAITGEPGGAPMKIGVALADVIAGKDAAAAILAALVQRAHAPASLPVQARRLRISLAHSATAALVNVAQNALVTGAEPARWGNAHPNLVPYQLFDTADQPIAIAVGSDPQWLACAHALGLAELAGDAGLATNAGRLAARGRIAEALNRRLKTGPARQWLDRLAAAAVPCGRVRSVLEALADVTASAVSGVAPQAPGTVRLPPPALDEHGPAIRRDGWRAFG